MSAPVLHAAAGAVFTITLDREEKRNALNNEVVGLIADGLRNAVARPDIRAVVLTGAGEKAFCAGGDLDPKGAMNFDFSQPRTPFGDLLRLAHDCPLPIVAAVNGHCLAGGMGLLALADMAVTVEDARFGLPEVKVGLFPMQVMSLLARLMPQRLLREWALTGDLYEAGEAKAAGLVNRIVPREALATETAALVDRLVHRSPTAIRRGKYALRALDGMTFPQAIAFAESQLGLMSLSGDAAEGLAAFREKREPKFRGD